MTGNIVTVERRLVRLAAAILLCIIFASPAVGEVEMSSAVEEALALCGRCATLPEEDVPGTIQKVRALVEKLEAEQSSANKVWLFRLKRCRSFLDYRLEAAGDGTGETTR